METNFTRSGLIVRLLTVMLISFMTNYSATAQSCACKESVQVSLDNTGAAVITSSMLKADDATCGGAGTVTVMLTPNGAAIAGSPSVNCSHAGKTLYGKVTSGTNSCWSRLIIEDKEKPVISCAPGVLDLTCTQMITWRPTATDNCEVLIKDIVILNETVTVNSCSNGLAANVLKRVQRTYQATDVNGNKSEPCVFTINVLTIPDLGAITMPPSYTVAAGTELECDGPWARLQNGNPSPTDIVVPVDVTLDGTGVPSLGGLNLFPDPDLYCNLMVSYTDTKLPQIGCVTKIMRTWQVIEWSCANRTRTPYVQIIEIKDTEGPTIAGLTDILASTSNHDCEATVNFVNAILDDNCADEEDLTADITIYPNGNLAAPGVFIKHGAVKSARLPVGSHIAVYTAYDACYNSSTASINVVIEDNTPPVAICDELATIGLTSDGTAWVSATVFDDGSYDECSLAKLLVRRMDNVNCAPCETPEFPGFILLGEYGTGANKHYYYLSQHKATPKAALKTAKAMGGYGVSYESPAERTAIRNFVATVSDTLDFLVGYTDLKNEGTYIWESGATNAMIVTNNTPLSDYVVVQNDAALLATNGRLLSVNNNVQYRYVVEITDPCGFSSHAQFCCADIGTNRMVALRAIDASGNFNDCMVSAVIQDKIGPTITCPADRVVNCDFVYDPKNLRKDFGWPTATDNCENPVITRIDSVNTVNSCRTGTITRRFLVTDAGGRTASCTQVITFAADIDHTYGGPTASQWPKDVTVKGCGNPLDYLPAVTGSPVLGDGACSLVGADYEDQVFLFNNAASPACFKIIRRWTVIDWCQPLMGGGYKTWPHLQEIKVIDDVAPVIDVLAPSVTANTFDAACASGSITLIASASDVCTDVLKWDYKIDALNNGTFDIFKNGTGDTIKATGQYPVGTHKIVYSFEDKCGNVSSKEQLFSIVNRKAPNAYVKQGLAMSLMQVAPGVGMAEIWATDFDNGSSHPCGYPILLSFTPVTVNALGNMVGTPNMVFDCADRGENGVTIYVAALTPAGDVVQSSVTTFIDIQDNATPKICPVTPPAVATVSGILATETDASVEDVFVNLVGSELTAMSNVEGRFDFRNMSTGGTYTVKPVKNDDHINGVSTLDLVMIQRHILSIDKLDSPYKLIASDANRDGKITAADLVELRKLILGTTTSFSNNKSWRFVDKGYTFQDVTFAQGEAFPEVYNIENLNTDMTTEFIAVKIGDVNGNVKANNLSNTVESRSDKNLVLTTENISFVAGQSVVIPVKVENVSDLSGLQFTLNFDREVLALTSIDPAGMNINDQNFGFNKVNEGIITASWNDDTSVAFSAGQTLFNLTFVAKSNGTTDEILNINSDVTKAEAYDSNAQTMNVSWNVTERTENRDFVLHQNVPNPFKEVTMVGFELPNAMVATLTVFDITGKVVKTTNINGNKGYNMIELNKAELSAGVMYYTLKAGEFTSTKKMVVIE
jgi:Cohesin domain/Secretion system C-terminal sorting domain/Dockerin type I domain